MLDERIEAVFESGVFRPLHPVDIPDNQRVTLVLPVSKVADGDVAHDSADESAEEFGYEPLPLEDRRTLRVRLKPIGEIPLVPFAVESGEAEDK
jgi:predicted DNA-binding antitoxin AbrB/MazE fold protein